MLALLLTAGLPSCGQEILSTTGSPLGGLEPWDPSPPANQCDQGIMARVIEILRPHMTRLDAAEATVQNALASQGWHAAAGAALTRRQAVCEDILAVIGIVQRHNKEVSDWRLGAFRQQYVLTTQFLTSGRLNAAPAGDAKEAPSQEEARSQVARGGRRWPHLSVVWVPCEAAFELHSEQRELLGQLGLSPAPWEDDTALALCALLALLGQADTDAAGGVTLAEEVRSFAEQTGVRHVETYGLGSRRADPRAVAQVLEAYLGRGPVVQLNAPEHAQVVALELGSYSYPTVLSAQAAACVTSVNAPVPRVFLAHAVWTAQTPDVTTFYQDKAALYAILAAALQTRVQTATGENAARQVTTLYAPYLWALTHCVPCLSPFRADVVGQGNIRFTDAWAPPDPAGRADPQRTEENLNVALAAKHVALRTDLFLLQADFIRNPEGFWQWTPRYAGFRGCLNPRPKATPASGAR